MNQIYTENRFKLHLGVMIKKIQIFGVPIGHAKITRNVQFNLAAPVMKYQQKLSYSCCLISLAT